VDQGSGVDQGSDHAKSLPAKTIVIIIKSFMALRCCFRPGNGPSNDDHPVHPFLRGAHAWGVLFMTRTHSWAHLTGG
jgi:hypothetical protein